MPAGGGAHAALWQAAMTAEADMTLLHRLLEHPSQRLGILRLLVGETLDLAGLAHTDTRVGDPSRLLLGVALGPKDVVQVWPAQRRISPTDGRLVFTVTGLGGNSTNVGGSRSGLRRDPTATWPNLLVALVFGYRLFAGRWELMSSVLIQARWTSHTVVMSNKAIALP